MTRANIRRKRAIAPWLAAAGLCLAALPVGAQTPLPVGAEFQVNTYTPAAQRAASVAMDADGDFVVVWESQGSSGTDTSQRGVLGQRYAADGSPQGAEFQVNTVTLADQFAPSVAMADDGDFVVVWGNVPALPPFPMSIQGQRFAADGSVQGAQFQVNSHAMHIQNSLNPSVAATADGAFVVVWPQLGSPGTDASDLSIQARRYASNGSALGPQFQVNTYVTGPQQLSERAVAVDADGDFVVVWYGQGSFGTDTDGFSVQGQRYASGGSALGTQFQINSATTANQSSPSVATAADGDFVVVWASYASSGSDMDLSVQGQRYGSDGSAQGAEFQVNTYTAGGQASPDVAVFAGGDFVVAWHSQGSSGTDTSESSIQGQRFTAGGSANGAEFQVNSYTTGLQWIASVAAADAGSFAVAWEGQGSFGSDTSEWAILGQRFRVFDASVPALSPAASFALGMTLVLAAAYALRRRV